MENRSLKELYELVLERYRWQFFEIDYRYGLCSIMDQLEKLGKISFTEHSLLRLDFDSKRPNINALFSWNLNDNQARIEFLENRIKELN